MDTLYPAWRNIRLDLAYDGTGLHGWQRQPGLRTVQACLEETIARVTGESVRLFGSGRTDAGVHALGQVANFTIKVRIPCRNLVKALNDALPPEIQVREAREAPLGFHARYAARSKTYRYRILLAETCSPFLHRFVWHYPHPLDHGRMAEAARTFLGEHDFTSFAAARAGSSLDDSASAASGERGPKSMVRSVLSSEIIYCERTHILAYEIRGSGFLHHMVRNIVGTLVEVGRGRMKLREVARILTACDRSLAGPTAPAQGLCLVRVEY